MHRWSMLAALLGAGVIAMAWQPVRAQPGGAPLNPANFTGRVVANPADDVRTLRLTFDPSARTNWHSHAGGQTLIVEKGRLRAMERGGTAKEFGPAQTYVTAPGVVHWHGALPDAPLTQIAVSFGATTWLEKVTDAQYNEAARK